MSRLSTFKERGGHAKIGAGAEAYRARSRLICSHSATAPSQTWRAQIRWFGTGVPGPAWRTTAFIPESDVW